MKNDRVREPGLDDPRAVDILTTEHWSLLSTRSLGYQEMLGRATIFVAILSGIVIALALLAQATRFGRETLLIALVLIAVALFIGLTTFVRGVAINFEDARWVEAMNLLRKGYVEIVPELEPFLISQHDPLAHGSRQRFENLMQSLTTTSSVVAALNSVLAGALATDICVLAGGSVLLDGVVGVVMSLVSAVVHVRYAARFRERRTPRPR